MIRGERGAIRITLIVGALVLAGAGFGIGLLVGGGGEDSASETVSDTALGDSEVGRQLFVSQRCSMCHSYEGRGGEDAPPLDFMTGNLAPADLAGMTGKIWNHLPAMEAAFKEEGIPFPTFEDSEMADLVAYLHGGGPPPDVPDAPAGDEG